MKIKKTKFNSKNYEYNSTMPIYCNHNDLSERHKELLNSSKTFCILPWIHLHALPNGQAMPCCLSDMFEPLGDLRKNTMKEIWNDKPMRQLRLNMLSDTTSKQCTKCYELETNGLFSMRNSFSKDFGHLIELTDKTNSDGSLDDFKLRYYDLRFSNLCNFRCRTCGPWFSSNWFNDHVKLYGSKPDVNGREMASVEYAGKSKYDMWEQMQEHIPHLEQIYFAGGEPLIMEEHYMILNELVKRKMFNVRLTYNTNFSVFKYKDQDAFDLWSKFDVVSVGASLDASQARGEYLRKGQVWNEVEENRRRMKEICPQVDFYVNCTVSLYNILHVCEFHKDWTERGFIRAQDWNINLCLSPMRDRCDILPDAYKKAAIEKIQQHLEWLEPIDKISRASQGYRGLINFLQQQDNSKFLPEFFKANDDMDRIRDEKFEDVFIEFADLRNYVR